MPKVLDEGQVRLDPNIFPTQAHPQHPRQPHFLMYTRFEESDIIRYLAARSREVSATCRHLAIIGNFESLSFELKPPRKIYRKLLQSPSSGTRARTWDTIFSTSEWVPKTLFRVCS